MAIEYDLSTERGTTFRFDLIFKDDEGKVVDLTDNWEVRMRVLARQEDDETVHSWTSEDDDIRLGDEGEIELHIKDEDTAQWDIEQGYYRLEIIDPDGELDRMVKGRWKVIP